ncbi:MAG: acetylglutamate kinase [Spirochaeta sp.]|nr:acetylglutamate kinase [Spirochaeta sp.]
MMRIVVKVGGTVAEDIAVTTSLLQELKARAGSVVLVHGGGKAVTRISEHFGITPVFADGVRVTSPEEMELVDMVLAGRVNTELVRLAHRAGVAAVGLTGADSSMLSGQLVGDPARNRTATVARVSPEVIELVLARGLLPVIASVGIGTDGHAVNINADEVARAIAVAMAKTDPDVALCYLSDTPGVLHRDQSVIPTITTDAVERFIADGVIQGGMAAKIRSSAAAIEAGLQRVVIGGYQHSGDLEHLLNGGQGTTVTAPEKVDNRSTGRRDE